MQQLVEINLVGYDCCTSLIRHQRQQQCEQWEQQLRLP